jgi:hypothetical protein
MVMTAVPRKQRRSCFAGSVIGLSSLWLRISDGVGRGIQILSTRHAPYWTMVSILSLLHEATNELGNLIRRGIEREVTRIENVDFGLRHVSAIGLRFRKLERQVVFAPEDE